MSFPESNDQPQDNTNNELAAQKEQILKHPANLRGQSPRFPFLQGINIPS